MTKFIKISKIIAIAFVAGATMVARLGTIVTLRCMPTTTCEVHFK